MNHIIPFYTGIILSDIQHRTSVRRSTWRRVSQR